MLYLELVLPTPEENLALDEALLEQAERAGRPREVLRIWEPARPLVVVGRSSRVGAEVNEMACHERNVPVLRRASGGAAVVTGPGCLMYALVLSYALRPALRAIDAAHRHVLGTLAGAIRPYLPGVSLQGTSDLALGDCKFSGNSMRAKRDHFLYHGTILYDFPLELVGACLAMPPRQPAYRAGRPHGAFLANLPLDPTTLRRELARAWSAGKPCADWPAELTRQLAAHKYSLSEWNHRY